ncbi:hypothetical protein DNH61_14965 [Paenibacillus sambharensis]|uniref:Uncharacterized protein n=1 Tax=Paenibacillus sambharensis TaxID=1803190 RepID=A0A2W1LIQ1_9BACL|nr:hypothetical protein [Paenibacillus sambharensis]PZD94942.1 hypothetical protein DNH61_14965 [Paenibacillus sambharensis]
MNRITVTVLACLCLIIGLSGCSNSEKVEINTPAFLYNSSSNTGTSIEVSISGQYDKDNNFQGSLTIGGMEYPTILFKHGFGLIAYDKAERTILGLIFYDNETKDYSIHLTEGKLYGALQGDNSEGGTLIISSPAVDKEQAVEVHTRLTGLCTEFEHNEGLCSR